MLPLWHKSVVVGMARDGMSFVDASTPGVRISACELDFDSVDAVRGALIQQSTLLKGASVELVMSNALARYLVMPWQAQIVSRHDWLALAKLALKQQFGSDAESWKINLSLGNFGDSVLVCAISSRVYDVLQAAARQIGFVWGGITPVGVRLLNQTNFSRHAWVMVVEPGYLQLFIRDRAGVLQDAMVASPPLGQEIEAAKRLVARHLVQAMQAPKETFVYLSGTIRLTARQYELETGHLLNMIYARDVSSTNAEWLSRA